MSINKSHIIWVVITVLLGAFGSGLWEYILKPIVLSGSTVFLEIATLGATAFKNSLYMDIAKGHHEESGLKTLVVIFGITFGILGSLSLQVFVPKFILTVLGVDERCANENNDTLQVRLKRRVLFPFVLSSVFMFIFSVIIMSRLLYINAAVTHFNQLMLISAPYLSTVDRLKYGSLFAQIQNRDDYVNVVSSLVKICEQNKVQVPKFPVW